MDYFLMTVLMLLGFFMMLIVLLQRGRGGGLAGAFGGAGGQSAFGTKAGDVFTKITIGIAVAWFALAGGTGIYLRTRPSSKLNQLGRAAEKKEAEQKKKDDAAKLKAEMDAKNAPPVDDADIPSLPKLGDGADDTKVDGAGTPDGPVLPDPAKIDDAKATPEDPTGGTAPEKAGDGATDEKSNSP